MQGPSELTQYGAIAVLAVLFLERSFNFAIQLIKTSRDLDLHRAVTEGIQPLATRLDDLQREIRASRALDSRCRARR